MSAPEFDVLDQNLGRLLREAYQPVEAAPKFRERVRRRFIGRVMDFAHERAEASRSEVSRAWSRAERWALAAASLLGLLFGVREWMRSGVDTRDEILARGAVAVRRAESAAGWFAVETGGDSAVLELEPGKYEIATPAEHPAEWAFGGATAAESGLTIFPDSRLSVQVGAERPEVALELGGIVVRRSAGSGPNWIVESRQGVVFVPSTALDVRVAIEAPDDLERWDSCDVPATQWMHVSVRRGRFEPSSGLPPGGDGYRCNGAWVQRRDEASASAPSRTSVDSAVDAVSPAAPQGYRRVLVRGRVLANGEALTKFEVVALETLNLPRVADPRAFEFESPTGEFELVAGEGGAPDLVAGVHTLFAKAPGYPPARAEVEITGAVADPIEVRFELNVGARLEGLVVDAASGRPIDGAYVVSETDSQLAALSLDAAENGAFASSARTRLEGDFVLAPLSLGSHSIRASAPGYGAAWSEVKDLRSGETRAGVRFELARAGSIFGVVLDDVRKPIQSAAVLASTTDFERKRPSITYAKALTDAEGRYSIEGLSAGSWALLNFGATPGARPPEFKFAQVRAGAASRVDFRPDSDGGQLVGRVLGADGQPEVGRSLMVGSMDGIDAPQDGHWITATTGADGSYRVNGLEPGPHALYISGRTPAEMMWVGQATVDAGPRTTHDVQLAGTSLRGVLFDGATATPMPFGVIVVIRNTPFGGRFQGRVFTREDGSFEIDYLEAGSYNVFAYATRGVYGQEQRVDVAVDGANDVEGLDFSLFPGGVLAVSLRDEQGEPVRGTVQFHDHAGVRVQFSDREDTGANGSYLVNGIRPGVWEVRASAEGFASASQSTTVRAGERSAVELVLRRP